MTSREQIYKAALEEIVAGNWVPTKYAAIVRETALVPGVFVWDGRCAPDTVISVKSGKVLTAQWSVSAAEPNGKLWTIEAGATE